jgi:hypothetical protein
VCAFPQRKAHEVRQSHEVQQEIRGSVVEGPAVNAYFPVESNSQPELTLAELSLMESTD